MYNQIINSRNEAAIVFLRCYCGGEILSIYYYPPTPTCQEIISLEYFGNIASKKLQKYKYYTFNRDTFNIFIDSLELCYFEGLYRKDIKYSNIILGINKKTMTFTEIELFVDLNPKKNPVKVWDIIIRPQELKEFIECLKQIQNKILMGENNGKVF